MNKTLLALTASAVLALTTGAFAQSNSTPGNPADASAGTTPAGRSDSAGGMMKGPSAPASANGTSTPAGPAATGAGQNTPTATGGQPGGSTSKN